MPSPVPESSVCRDGSHEYREEIQREEVGGDKVANVAVYSRQVGGGDLVTEVKRELLYSSPTL